MVWEGWDDSDNEIYFWPGSGPPIKVTNNSGSDESPQIDGDRLVWQSKGSDYEIFYASYDSVRPRARMITPRVSTDISRTRKFKVKWSGYDPANASSQGAAQAQSMTSGVASYDVQYKVGRKGGWRNFRVNTTKKAGYFKGWFGKTYYFRSRAEDKARNVGKYSKPKATIVPFDNDSFKSKRGFRRLKRKKSGEYLRTLRHSSNQGDTIVYRKRGNLFSIIAKKGRRMSRAQVYVDGKRKRIINTYSKKTRSRKVVFTVKFRRIKAHTIKIVNLAKKPNRRDLYIDGFAARK